MPAFGPPPKEALPHPWERIGSFLPLPEHIAPPRLCVPFPRLFLAPSLCTKHSCMISREAEPRSCCPAAAAALLPHCKAAMGPASPGSCSPWRRPWISHRAARESMERRTGRIKARLKTCPGSSPSLWHVPLFISMVLIPPP